MMSGLKINFHKSRVDGYGSVKQELSTWSSILGCQVGNGHLKYLGATLGESPSKLTYWNPLIEKFRAKLITWNTSSVSMAGRLVLLKASLDSIPNYWFTMFKVPQETLQKIEQIRNQFLWGDLHGGVEKKHGMHLLKLEKVCLPKQQGGLGLISLKQMNLVLIAKWWWRCYNERSRMWNNLISQRYGKHVNYNILNIPISNDTSSMFRAIISIGNSADLGGLIGRDCFKWKINNGEKVLFWED